MVDLGYGMVLIIMCMEMNHKRPKTIIIIITVILLLIIVLVNYKTQIQYENVCFTVPFIVLTKDYYPDGVSYYNGIQRGVPDQQLRTVQVFKTDITQGEYNAEKEIKLNIGEPYLSNFGKIYSQYRQIELFYYFTDAGPETYAMFVHQLHTDNYYYFVLRGFSSVQVDQFIETIHFE